MLIHIATYNTLEIRFYASHLPDTSPANTIFVRVDTSHYGVRCDCVDCTDCPLGFATTAKYTGENCAERGIDYFNKITDNQFTEWSI